MFDLHSHVLPGVDDGAKNIDISLTMLKIAKKQGVNTVAATPHCVTDSDEGVQHFVERRKAAYEKMMVEIEKEGKENYPEIVLGAEVYLGCDISEFSSLDQICYQNTNYILLEMANGYSPEDLAEWVYNVQIKGYRPVIAHIDRYVKYKEFMEELTPLDPVFQVNASQFYSMSGRSLLKHIFKRHNKFFVSSDMHNLTDRACNFEGAYKIASKKFSKECDILFREGARCILEGRDIVEM